MPRVPGDVPQVSFQPTQMPGFAAPAVQPAQNFGPQQMLQLAGGLQDVGQASSRIGSAMQRQDLAKQEQNLAEQEAQQKELKAQMAAAQREQDRLDETSAGEAVNNFRMFAITKRTDFGKLEGKDAASKYAEYQKAITDYGDEIQKGLANDTQRQLYKSKRELFQFDTINSMDVHAYTENKRYQSATSKSSAELNAQSYIDSTVESLTPRKESITSQYMTGSLPRIRPEAYRSAMEADIRAAMAGQPEESIKVEIAQATKQLHSNTLEAITAKRDFDAVEKYVDKHEKEMDPKTAIDYRRIASSTKATINASKIAISIAAPHRGRDGYLSAEKYSALIQEIDSGYNSGKIKWDEETYKNVKSSLRSIKESDDGVRDRINSDLVSQALTQIEYQKSAQAREDFVGGIGSRQVDPLLGTPLEIEADRTSFPIVDDDAYAAERAFQAQNPQLYAKLDRAGKLDDVRKHLAGGGESDPEALLEIERNAQEDPGFFANLDINRFVSDYGLKLNRKDFETYRNKFINARDEAYQKINQLSDQTQNIMITRALQGVGMVDVTGEVVDADKDKDKSKNHDVARIRADIRAEWDVVSNEYKSANAGRSPGRDEFQGFLDSYMKTRKDIGIDKPFSSMTKEDLGNIFVSAKDKNNKVYSASFADIDQPLIDLAVAKISSDNSRLHTVVTDDADSVVLGRFATRKEAEDFIVRGGATAVAKRKGLSTKSFVPSMGKMKSVSKSSLDVANTAMELLANGEYTTGEGKILTAPDTARRVSAIVSYYNKAKTNFGDKAMAFAASFSGFGTYEKNKEAFGVAVKDADSKFVNKVESLRDDIFDGKSISPTRLSLEEVDDIAYALTGYDSNKLVKIGALKIERKKTAIEGFEGGATHVLTTAKFDELVKEVYEQAVNVLKKEKIRQ